MSISFSATQTAATLKTSQQARPLNSTQTGTYKQFGQGRYSYELASDLLKFRDEAISDSAPETTFRAVFKASDDLSASEFNACLKNELSFLLTHSEVAGNWEPQLCEDEPSNTLCFTLDGTTFKVTGLHPYSANSAERASYPTLVFQIHERSESFAENKTSRSAEEVIAHFTTTSATTSFFKDLYEDESGQVIQFSGREDTSFWKTSFAQTQTYYRN